MSFEKDFKAFKFGVMDDTNFRHASPNSLMETAYACGWHDRNKSKPKRKTKEKNKK